MKKALKFKNLFFVALILSISSLNAVDTDYSFNPEQQRLDYDQNGNIIGSPLSYPFDTKSENLRFSNPQILKDRFELNLNENFAKTVSIKKDRYSKIMTETLDVNLLIDTSVRQIRNTDVLYIHPHFLTTINFPFGTEIIYAKASTDIEVFDFSQNLLMIQPPKDFVNGNLLVTYRDNERTYYTNIIIQKYTQVIFRDEFFNKYVIDDNYLSLNYQYVREIEYNPIDILKKYFALNGDDSIKLFKKNGDYDVILLNGVSFYIIQDSSFGTIDYKNKRFKISQNYDFGDKSMLGRPVSSKNRFYPSTEYKGKKWR